MSLTAKKPLSVHVSKRLLQALHGEDYVAQLDAANSLQHELQQVVKTVAESEKSDIAATYKPRKKAISIRLDMDVLEWFKSLSGKYQQHINKACREYMQKQIAAVEQQELVS